MRLRHVVCIHFILGPKSLPSTNVKFEDHEVAYNRKYAFGSDDDTRTTNVISNGAGGPIAVVIVRDPDGLITYNKRNSQKSGYKLDINDNMLRFLINESNVLDVVIYMQNNTPIKNFVGQSFQFVESLSAFKSNPKFILPTDTAAFNQPEATLSLCPAHEGEERQTFLYYRFVFAPATPGNINDCSTTNYLLQPSPAAPIIAKVAQVQEDDDSDHLAHLLESNVKEANPVQPLPIIQPAPFNEPPVKVIPQNSGKKQTQLTLAACIRKAQEACSSSNRDNDDMEEMAQTLNIENDPNTQENQILTKKNCADIINVPAEDLAADKSSKSVESPVLQHDDNNMHFDFNMDDMEVDEDISAIGAQEIPNVQNYEQHPLRQETIDECEQKKRRYEEVEARRKVDTMEFFNQEWIEQMQTYQSNLISVDWFKIITDSGKDKRKWVTYKFNAAEPDKSTISCRFCENFGEESGINMGIHLSNFAKPTGQAMNPRKDKNLQALNAHQDSNTHKQVVAYLLDGSNKRQRVDKMCAAVEERTSKELDQQRTATMRMMLTVYAELKSNIPMNAHEYIVELQKLNSAKLGVHHGNRRSGQRMALMISEVLHSKLLDHIRSYEGPIAIIVDGTTEKPTPRAYFIVYFRFLEGQHRIAAHPIVHFYTLINTELEVYESAERLKELLLAEFEKDNITQAIKKNLVAFVSDGAPQMQGNVGGLGVLLSHWANRILYRHHCLSHKIELVMNVLKGKPGGRSSNDEDTDDFDIYQPSNSNQRLQKFGRMRHLLLQKFQILQEIYSK